MRELSRLRDGAPRLPTAIPGPAELIPCLTPGGRFAMRVTDLTGALLVSGDLTIPERAEIILLLPADVGPTPILQLTGKSAEIRVVVPLEALSSPAVHRGHLYRAEVDFMALVDRGSSWVLTVLSSEDSTLVPLSIEASPSVGAGPQVIAAQPFGMRPGILYLEREGGLRFSVGNLPSGYLNCRDEVTLTEMRWESGRFLFTAHIAANTGVWDPASRGTEFSLGLMGKRNPRLWRVAAERLRLREEPHLGVGTRLEFSCSQVALENACLLAGQDALVSMSVRTSLGELELPVHWGSVDWQGSESLPVVDVKLDSGEFLVASCNRSRSVGFSFCDAESLESKRRPIEAILSHVSLNAGVLRLRGKASPIGPDMDVDKVLVAFTKQHTDISFTTAARLQELSSDGGLHFGAEVLVSDLLEEGRLGSGKWHARLVVELKDGSRLSQRLKRPLKGFARRNAFRSYGEHFDSKSGLLAFPELTVPGYLVLALRPPTEADSPAVRFRQKLALALALLLPNIRDRSAWLITEKKADTAQDNSFVFFQYCYDHHHEKPVYYLIRRSSQHRKLLVSRSDRVVDFGSLRHFLLLLRCGVLVSSEASAHFIEFDSVPSYYKFAVRMKKYVFLQHGVTAMKNVAGIFGRKGQWSADRFVTTSAWEQRIACEYLGYSKREAPITGFARWDLLENKCAGSRQVMVMPTWRNWLHHESPEAFQNSDFFRNYRELLQSERLADVLEEHDATVLFVLHPYLEKFVDQFRSASPRVILQEIGEHPVNELLMESAILVSDYSSVVWDFLKMDKPVIFFQFDSDEYLKRHGSFIDFETELPGPRSTDLAGVVEEIRRSLENGCKVGADFSGARARAFEFEDRNNCERIYAVTEELERLRFYEVRKMFQLVTGRGR